MNRGFKKHKRRVIFINIIQLLWNICLLRKGPDILPYSVSLFIIVTLINYAFVLAGVWDVNNLGLTALKGGSLILVALFLVYGLLYFRGIAERFVQTATAIFGTSAIISLGSLPLVAISWLLQTSGVEASGIHMLLFTLVVFLYIWSVAVDGWIFSNAMNISMGFGLFWAILLELVNMLLFNYFF